MSDLLQQSGRCFLRPQEDGTPRAPESGESRTARNEAIAGFVLSLLGFFAALYPGDLLVTLPLLAAGLYVSGTSLRVLNGEVVMRRLAIAGIVIGVLGLVITVVLFVVFIG